MAKIFISHSRHDKGIVNFMFQALHASGVDKVIKEYEDVALPGTPAGQINRNMAEEIDRDIMASSAVFVVLSETVQQLSHTWSWIVWECGQAKARQKPIWIFEPYESFGRVSVNVPSFNHYVRYQINDATRRYIHVIARSYRDAPALLLSGGVLTALALGGGPLGAVIGGGLGYLLGNANDPPKGFGVTCRQCFTRFEVHLPGGRGDFRCAGCNRPGQLV